MLFNTYSYFLLLLSTYNVQTPFDTHTDLVFQNPGILKFHDIVISLIQIENNTWSRGDMEFIFECSLLKIHC